MRFVALLLVSIGCTPAVADSITQTTETWPIKTAARPVAARTDKPVMYTQYLGSCSEDDVDECPWDGESKVFSSNWSFVKCTATYDAVTNTNHYHRVFRHDLPTAWPISASWPTTSTCHVDGTGAWAGDYVDTSTTIVNHADPDGTGSTLTALANLSTSVPLVRDSTGVGGHWETMEWAKRTLPAGTYIDGTTTCKKANGTPHPGLEITVNENGTTDHAIFRANGLTVTNSSTCPISKGETIYNIPVPVTVEAH